MYYKSFRNVFQKKRENVGTLKKQGEGVYPQTFVCQLPAQVRPAAFSRVVFISKAGKLDPVANISLESLL